MITLPDGAARLRLPSDAEDSNLVTVANHSTLLSARLSSRLTSPPQMPHARPDGTAVTTARLPTISAHPETEKRTRARHLYLNSGRAAEPRRKHRSMTSMHYGPAGSVPVIGSAVESTLTCEVQLGVLSSSL